MKEHAFEVGTFEQDEDGTWEPVDASSIHAYDHAAAVKYYCEFNAHDLCDHLTVQVRRADADPAEVPHAYRATISMVVDVRLEKV